MSRRLADAYSRYAALIVAQLEALERGDLDALEPLGRERDALAEQIDREPAADRDAAEVRRALDRCHAADMRLRARLGTLRADALQAVRRLGRDAAAVRSYAGTALPGARFDVEL